MKQARALFLTILAAAAVSAAAQQTQQPSEQVITRGNSTIVLEPYAPNIMHVTLSLLKDQALKGPGYGISGEPSAEGWSYERNDEGEVYRSSEMVVKLSDPRTHGHWTPLPTQIDISKFFGGSTPGANITFERPDGTMLADMEGWQMSVPNYKDGNHDILYDRRPQDDPFYQVGASFASPADEHYYGLGENQEGYLDHRDHQINCWNDYDAVAAPTFCVPLLVTNKGYAILWDNPSKTTIAPGFNGQTRFSSQVGTRVSFFVIAGKNYDEIYEGYRKLTGSTPMLPKAAYGFIQCKQRYSSQAEVMAVANGYRERHLPADMIVIDWFYYTKMGQMDLDPTRWPDPTAMNKQLHAMGFQTMISVWPRFVPQDRYYDFILKHGWFEHLADGTPTNGLPYDRAGSDIDTTNPEAAKWYWGIVRENLLSKGFDAFWADETEPDLPPNGSYFSVGPGTQYFDVYPTFHTGAFYDGFRRDTDKRALVLARDAYLGTQHNGTTVWSSDIGPNWDTLRRQIPTGIDVTASGIPYWGNDIGGWQYLPAVHHPERPVLVNPAGAESNIGGYEDYPELYVRWFEYGVFEPTFRTHGSRRYNEVWSYGPAAEPILEKFLRLRYALMPYIYSLGWYSHETGAPFMRGLFMDFPNDPKVAEIGDEYMFGPALLVAPVYEQGMTTRKVYLPAGADWYNYWTHERLHGGQTIDAAAPIDQIPLFVKAGSIIPMGAPVESTEQVQKIAALEVFPGADANFTLYNDDGHTYNYEKGDHQITQLHWDDATHQFSHTGAKAWDVPDSELVKVIGQ